MQELVEGSSLAQMVQAGWKPSKQEVERIAAELLSTLSYLQKQQVSDLPMNVIMLIACMLSVQTVLYCCYLH